MLVMFGAIVFFFNTAGVLFGVTESHSQPFGIVYGRYGIIACRAIVVEQQHRLDRQLQPDPCRRCLCPRGSRMRPGLFRLRHTAHIHHHGYLGLMPWCLA